MNKVPAGADGVRAIRYSRVTEVHPGYSVASETIWTGAFELRETIQFLDHPSGGTHVNLVYWVDTAPITPTRAQQLQYNLSRLPRGFLGRATAWHPGTPHKPNTIAPEAEDLR